LVWFLEAKCELIWLGEELG